MAWCRTGDRFLNQRWPKLFTIPRWVNIDIVIIVITDTDIVSMSTFLYHLCTNLTLLCSELPLCISSTQYFVFETYFHICVRSHYAILHGLKLWFEGDNGGLLELFTINRKVGVSCKRFYMESMHHFLTKQWQNKWRSMVTMRCWNDGLLSPLVPRVTKFRHFWHGCPNSVMTRFITFSVNNLLYES